MERIHGPLSRSRLHEHRRGARLKYFVYSGERLLALPGFGASAWKIAPRDWYIGRPDDKREENLKLVVNNARFLILPWANSKNLASMILSRVASRLPEDRMNRYHYRAANWKRVGSTKGRGRATASKTPPLR